MSSSFNRGILIGLALVMAAVLGLTAGCGPGPTAGVASQKNSAVTSAKRRSLQCQISPEAALTQFEETHRKFSSVQDAVAAAPAVLRSEVRVPKDTLGTSLAGAYVSDAGQPPSAEQPPSVTLRYSNNMGISVTQQTVAPDYAAQCKYLRDLDKMGYGHHTTYAYTTTVKGYQAIAQERGQNADGSQCGGYIEWYANGTQHMVFGGSLGVEDLMKVANSMY